MKTNLLFFPLGLIELSNLGSSVIISILLCLLCVSLLFLVFYLKRLLDRYSDENKLLKDWTEAGTDRLWEMDKNLCFTRIHAHNINLHDPDSQIGLTRWEAAGADALNDPNWKAHREDLEARREFANFRYQLQKPDSGICHWSVSGRPFYNKRGEFQGYRGTAKDITNEVVEQEKAAKAQEVLLNALDSISEGFCLWDKDDRLILGNERFVDIHPEFKDHFRPGVQFRELVELAGSTGLYCVDQEGLEEYKEERMRRHLNPGAPFVQRLKGNRWVHVTERKTKDGGIVGVWTDITALKRREQELLQAQKMEAVGQLTGGIAHDFNNLLTVVLGNLEFLYEELSDRYLRKLAVRAIMAAERGSTLTERLLAFSRQQTLQPHNLDIRGLIEGMKELLERSLGERIKIRMSFVENLWLVIIDPQQFESALLNLTLNARDAMSGEGMLSITVGNLIVNSENNKEGENLSSGEYVVVSIQDNGVGMSIETKKRAFEPFFSTKDVGKGSGMGLSMVYGFVRQSGGHVTIDSAENVGTTIKLYLPKAKNQNLLIENKGSVLQIYKPGQRRWVDNAEQIEVEENITRPLPTKEKILVVEDEAMVRALIVSMLIDMGYEVHEAEDAQNAFVLLDDLGRVDMILTDIVLPHGMSGPELVEEAVKHFPGLRWLFMSGYPEHAALGHASLEDNSLLLSKPFRKSELESRIKGILESPNRAVV